MATFTEVALSGDSLTSNAPVSGNLFECGPLFVDEYSILLCASGSLIQAISSKTGELIGSFSGHSACVTCIRSCPSSYDSKDGGNEQTNIAKASPLVVSTSIDGCIIVWNKKTFKEVSRTDIKIPLYEILVPSTSVCSLLHGMLPMAEDTMTDGIESDPKDELYLVVTITADSASETSKKNSRTLVIYNIRQQKVKRRLSNVAGRQCSAVLGAASGDIYIVAAAVKPFVIFYGESARGGPKLRLDSGPATCIATVESTGNFVTGHRTGEINVFHDVSAWLQMDKTSEGKKQSSPPSTLLHWHAHAVFSLTLSLDGGYLYSGADEAVLVVWQLASGAKEFVPRLGGAIKFISSSSKEAKVAVATADNCIQIVNVPTLKSDWELRALFVPRSEDSKYDVENQVISAELDQDDSQKFLQSDIKFRCEIRIETRSGYVACNGYPGQIQVLDLATQTYKTSHEIVQFQRVTRMEVNDRTSVPSTMHFNFLHTSLGSFMVTVDVRRGEELEAEASLKFWEWDSYRSKYRLSAQVDRPHGSWKVTDAVFSPSSSHNSRIANRPFSVSCATAAVDGSIKIWLGQLQEVASTRVSKFGVEGAAVMQWSCSFSFKHRDCPTNALAFSLDGSLLSASYQNVVTLWDPAQVLLWKSIVIPSRNNVTFTAFIEPKASAQQGGGNGEAMLVVGSKRCLSVYDLISMDVIWSIEGWFSSFAVAPDEAAAISCAAPGSSDPKCSNSHTVAWIAAAQKRGIHEPKTSDPSNKIVLFSCYSPKPLCTQHFYPRVTSMIFWSNQKDVSSSLGAGLVALTAHGEVLLVAAADALRQHFTSRPAAPFGAAQAKVGGVKVPAIAFADVVQNYNQSSSSAEVGGIAGSESKVSSSAFQQSTVAVSKNWLGGIFDSKSASIPPLSAIYDDFVGGLIDKKHSNTRHSAFSPADMLTSHTARDAASTSPLDTNSSSTTTIANSDQLTSAEEIVKNNSFTGQRKEMFAEGLSSFFLELLEPSNGHSTGTQASGRSSSKRKSAEL